MILANSFLLECKVFVELPVHRPPLSQGVTHVMSAKVPTEAPSLLFVHQPAAWNTGAAPEKRTFLPLALPKTLRVIPGATHTVQQKKDCWGIHMIFFALYDTERCEALIPDESSREGFVPNTLQYKETSVWQMSNSFGCPQKICPQQKKPQVGGSTGFCPFLIVFKLFIEFTGNNIFSETTLLEKQQTHIQIEVKNDK